MTSLTGLKNLRRFDQQFALTNRLRTTGTGNLIAAMQDVGVPRLIAQSYTGWTNPRTGSAIKDESDPLDPAPTMNSRETLAAIRYLEERVTTAAGIHGVALRYGSLYGPGTGLGEGGDLLALVKRRQLPLVGGGGGIWSMLHIDDAASATVQALDHGDVAVYNVVDDEPAPVSEWLPNLAEAVGAKPPMRLPVWLARSMLGEHGVSLMTCNRGSSHVLARQELGWEPPFGSWGDGFRSVSGELGARHGVDKPAFGVFAEVPELVALGPIRQVFRSLRQHTSVLLQCLPRTPHPHRATAETPSTR